MGRQPRIEYSGATYHVMCRGNRQGDVFENDGDREVFLETLAQVCERTGWKVCAYVLMSNHYHMVLETPEANLVAGMKWFQGTYTKRFNVRNRQWGHLFQGRYKSIVIDPEESEYFGTACDYIHLNPVRAGLVGGEGQPTFRDYKWSSSWYLSHSVKEDPGWLNLDRIVQAHAYRPSDRHSRMIYLSYLESRFVEELRLSEEQIEREEYKALRRGWVFGSREFKEELKGPLNEELKGLRRDTVSGEPRRLHDEHEANGLLRSACEVIGLSLSEKDQLRKNDLRKQTVAWFLFRKTPMGQDWLAKQLGMGNRANVSRAVKEIEATADDPVATWKRALDEMYRFTDWYLYPYRISGS